MDVFNFKKITEISETEYMQSKIKQSFSRPLLFIVVVISTIFVMSVAFRVEDIQVSGNEHYTADEIINAVEIEQGDNLFFFDRFAAVSRVFAKLPYVDEVSVTRNLPNKVIIEIVESKALAYIVLGNENWTIDKDCKILGKVAEGEEASLIPVEGFDPGTLFIGEYLTDADESDRATVYLKKILDNIQGRNMSSLITKIDFSNVNNVVVYYNNRFIINLGDPNETDTKFGMVESAILQLREGDSGILDVTDALNTQFTPY